MSRCVCGHPEQTHEHYRHGTDCGECGRGRCPWFIALADRDRLAGLMTPEQRVALAESDAQAHRIIAHLREFQASAVDRARALLATIPAQRRGPTLARELEIRRGGRPHRKGVVR